MSFVVRGAPRAALVARVVACATIRQPPGRRFGGPGRFPTRQGPRGHPGHTHGTPVTPPHNPRNSGCAAETSRGRPRHRRPARLRPHGRRGDGGAPAGTPEGGPRGGGARTVGRGARHLGPGATHSAPMSRFLRNQRLYPDTRRGRTRAAGTTRRAIGRATRSGRCARRHWRAYGHSRRRRRRAHGRTGARTYRPPPDVVRGGFRGTKRMNPPDAFPLSLFGAREAAREGRDVRAGCGG